MGQRSFPIVHPEPESENRSAVRAIALITAVIAVGFGVTLSLGIAVEDLAIREFLYTISAAGAGVALLVAARVSGQSSRLAWTLVGAGVLCWGIGEAVWMIQARTGEIPYPGIADFFYVAGYPLIFAGVIALPYLRPGRYERIRLAIDAAAGTVSLAVLMWVLYLQDVVSLGSDPLETFLNVLYPLGDLFLVTALMVLAMRRSEQRLDLRILLLSGAVALTALADVVFSLQTSAGTYVEWGWLDGWWLFSYGMFALTAWYLTRPVPSREATYRASKGWQLVAPYSAVGALFLLRLFTSSGSDLLLNLATTAVAVLVVVRQNIAVKEKKELLERQRDDLVASVSHELRTPLTGIQGYAQILAESWEFLSDEERNEMLGTIDSQATHLGHIVSDLIDVARDRLQNVQLKPADFAAADLVRDAVAATSTEGKVRIEADTEARLWADPDRLRQVMVNLITNATRYGGPEILITVTRDDDMVLLAVHDNGSGVPAKFQSEMWGRFERGMHKDDSKVPGSGIGLSVAKDLVTAHGGTIGYRTSEILGGACFELRIPAPSDRSSDLVTAGATRSG